MRLVRFVAICLLCAAAVFAQTEKRPLTLEWIFGPHGGAYPDFRRRLGSVTLR
jgi:hypothetical protein